MIATGSLACGVAQADSVIVAAIGETGQGFDSRLPTLYSDDQTTFERASNSLFDPDGNLSGTIGLGSFTLASEPLGFHDWVAVLPPHFKIARDDWMMFFSDLSSVTGDYWALLRGPLASPDFLPSLAEMPPAIEMARDWEIRR